jgi:DNA-binding MarR family transcriptional regulator
MNPSSKKSNSSFKLADVTTYQSGVAQASAFRVVKHHTAHFLKDYNLSCMQWFTIGTILDAGTEGIRLSDLASTLDTTLAYMTTTVNLLESREIINKKAHQYDARTKLVSVNPKYKKTCAKIEEGLRARLREVLYENISHEELTTYVKVLYKLSKLR